MPPKQGFQQYRSSVRLSQLDMDAKSVVDVCLCIGRIYQQRRSKTSVESGIEEIGSSMRIIASDLLQQDIGQLAIGKR